MGPPTRGDGCSSKLSDAITVGDLRVPGFVCLIVVPDVVLYAKISLQQPDVKKPVLVLSAECLVCSTVMLPGFSFWQELLHVALCP